MNIDHDSFIIYEKQIYIPMKKIIIILVTVSIIMAPLVVFSFIQFLKSFKTGEPLLGLCSIGAFIFVLKSFFSNRKKYSS